MMMNLDKKDYFSYVNIVSISFQDYSNKLKLIRTKLISVLYNLKCLKKVTRFGTFICL